MSLTKHALNKKLFLLTFIVSIAFCFIAGRLIYLQIYLSGQLLSRSKRNFLRNEKTLSLRGNIFDTNGRILATNRPVITIYWQGTGQKRLTPQQHILLSDLEHMIEKKLIDRKKIEQVERLSHQLSLVKDISFQELSCVSEFFTSNPNICIKTESTRFYPHKSLASHLLGYLGYLDIDLCGKTGLEKLYEETLKGQKGKTLRIINSVGKHLKEEKIELARAGKDIHITLDLSLQQKAEMLFPKDKSGVFLLMDPEDGSIKIFLSYPNFDPNIFLKRLDHETWKKLQTKSKPFLNRIINAQYPPGSIFKLISLGAAIEQQLLTSKSIFHCRGFTKVGRRFRCHKHDGHGDLNPIEAISQSCNILFYEISKKLDIDILAHYARKFGFGKTTHGLFKSKPGLIPTRAWKQATKGEPWWLGETLSVSIGQSFLLVTPLQVARMVAAIETGYLVTPRISQESPATYEPLNISYKTRQFLKKAMRAVTEEGTAKMLNKLEDFTIYTKTSTAQTSALHKRKMGTEHMEHGWVVANFSYKNYKPMTMVILTEHTGSAGLSLLIAREFLKSYRDLMDLREKRKKK